MKQTCENCKFFYCKYEDQRPNFATCRRFPPIKDPRYHEFTIFPNVKHDIWCGEWKLGGKTP